MQKFEKFKKDPKYKKAKERLEEIEKRIAPFTKKKYKKQDTSKEWDIQPIYFNKK